MMRQGMFPVALVASVVVGGCQTMGAQQTESQLSASGFTRLQADTPHKVANIQTLPQNQFVFAQRKKGNVYIYADYAGCGCAYVGNEAAYQSYQALRAANNIAEMQQTTAMLNADAAADWGGAWGPYAPYYWY